MMDLVGKISPRRCFDLLDIDVDGSIVDFDVSAVNIVVLEWLNIVVCAVVLPLLDFFSFINSVITLRHIIW